MRPRVRLSLASCAFVFVMAYVAWHNQHPARKTLPPEPAAALSDVTPPEPPPVPAATAVPRAVLDPQPSWGAEPVPVLQPSLTTTSDDTAREAAPPQPQFQDGAKTEPEAPPAGPALVPAPSTPDAAPIPLPRPRPRRAAVTAPKRPPAAAPLRIN